MRYEVEYLTPSKDLAVEKFTECKDAGMAFAKCQKAHPDCTMVRAIATSGLPPFSATMEHEYPSPVQRQPIKEPRPARPLKPGEKDGVMPFYDEVVRK